MDPLNDCIDWTKARDRQGYGYAFHKGRNRRAHRVAYCQAHGIELENIEGLVVRHKCDRPPCVNPDHLELGTVQDNTRDRVTRGRSVYVKGENHGQAKLTDDLVRTIRAEYVPYSREFGTIALGRKYGVSHTVISAVIRRRIWTHVD